MTGPAGGRRRFGLQVAYLTAARFSTVVALFGVTLVAARTLPETSVGSAAVGQTIGMIAALVANGGINIATIYYLQSQPTERSRIVGRVTAIAVVACSVAGMLVLASAPFLFSLIGSVELPLLLAAGTLGIAMIGFEFSGALLLGLGLPGRFTMLELIRGWCSLAAVVVLLIGLARTDTGLVLGLALGYAGAAVMGLTWTSRAGMPLAPRYDGTFTRAALAFGLRGQVGNVFQFLGVRLDLLLVPALIDLRAAGIYFVAVRVSDAVGQAATAASSLVFPQVAGDRERGSTHLTERVVRMTILAIAPAILIVGMTGQLVLGTAFGDAYAEGAGALTILLAATLPLAIGRVIAADLKGRGRPGLVSVSAAVSVGATIVFDLALIPVLGIEGAAVASLLTYAAGMILLLLAYRSVTQGSLMALVPRPSDLGEVAASIRQLAR